MVLLLDVRKRNYFRSRENMKEKKHRVWLTKEQIEFLLRLSVPSFLKEIVFVDATARWYKSEAYKKLALLKRLLHTMRGMKGRPVEWIYWDDRENLDGHIRNYFKEFLENEQN